MEAGLEHALGTVVGVLDELEMPYAIVGGLAVSAWAVPRATRDVDLWVEMGTARGELERALRAAGFDVPAMTAELQRFGVFRSKMKQSGVFVDIFDAVGPLGEAIIARRIAAKVGPHRVWVASAEDVAALKAYSDRARDFDDLVELLAHAEMDTSYLERWARELDASIGTDEVSERLERASAKARKA